MILATANLGRGVDDEAFEENVWNLWGSLPGACIGFQEIDEADTPDEHEIIDKAMHRGNFAGWQTHTPIKRPFRWRIAGESVIPACKGLAHLTPHKSIVETHLFHEDSDRHLIVLNVHFPRRDPRLWSRRRQCRRKLRERLDHWWGLGFTVVWMGDTNTPRMRSVHPRERTLTAGRIDYIRVLEHPNGPRAEIRQTGTVQLSIDDHDAQWVRVHWQVKR